MNKIHYVYRITNILLKKHYYGTRSTTKSNPCHDLGVTYFSSSKDTDFKMDQKLNPNNYKYKIVRICNTREQAIVLEIHLHNKFNVATSSNFYNRSKQTSKSFDTSGIALKNFRSYTMSEETKQKIREANLGKTQSIETIAKRVAKLKGHITSEETKAKIGAANKIRRTGTSVSLAQRAKQSKKDVYTFTHKTGLVKSCTVWELKEEYGLCEHIYGVVNGHRKSTGGWKILPS